MKSPALITAMVLMVLSGCTNKEVSNDARVKPTDSGHSCLDGHTTPQTIDEKISDDLSPIQASQPPFSSPPVDAEKMADAVSPEPIRRLSEAATTVLS